MSLTTAEAEKILQAAKAKATEMGLRVSIAVVDTRGELMAMVRLDGARWPTARVCQGKAYASVTYGVPSADLAQRADGPIFRNMMIQEGGRLIPAQGAMPIKRGDEVVGAVGVSGAASAQDEEIATVGVQAL